MPDATVAAAGWIGAHALAVFLVLLGTLLTVVAVGIWGLRVHLLPRLRSRLAPELLVPASAFAGFVTVVAAAALFAEIAEHLAPDGTMAAADEALAAAIGRHASAATVQVFAGLTHFGDPAVLGALGVVVALWLWVRRNHALALGWVFAVGGNALLNPALKRIFERVRPIHEPGLVSASSWSFPSGHTSSSSVAYGMLAYLALRTLPRAWHVPTVLVAAAMAFTVGCSRIFLQVHFASDVAAGFVSGFAWLTVCIVSVEISRFRPAG